MIIKLTYSAITSSASSFSAQNQTAYNHRLVYSQVRALQEQYAAELEAETELQNRCEAACAAQQVYMLQTLPAMPICTVCLAIQSACFAHPHYGWLLVTSALLGLHF